MEQIQAKFVCYDNKSGNTATADVVGNTLSECEQIALKKTGMNRIARGRILKGDVSAIMKSERVKLTNIE